MSPTEGVVIGRVLRPWGRRGEMLVQALTHDRGRFDRLAEVWVRLRGRTVGRRVRSARLDFANRPLIAIEGIDDITGAEALRGAELLVEAAEVLQPKDPSTFLTHELEGLEVIAVDGTRIGRVEQVVDAPGASLFVVRDDRGAEILIPAVRQFIIEVEIANGRIRVDLPPGLVEVNSNRGDAGAV